MRPFLILQIRPETEAADDEFAAFLARGGLGDGEVRRIRVESEPLPAALDPGDFAAVIVGGGPGCVSDPPAGRPEAEARAEAAVLSLLPEIVARDLPFLGCCSGIGLLAHHLGAEVSKRRYGEPVGPVSVRLTGAGREDPLTRAMPERFNVLVGHKEAVQALPRGTVQLVEGAACPIQMIRAGRNVYATQFHPESGPDNFALRIRIYRDRGYFAPADAGRLEAACRAVPTEASADILRRFVARYRAEPPLGRPGAAATGGASAAAPREAPGESPAGEVLAPRPR